MIIDYDAEGQLPTGGSFILVPDGDYDLQIIGVEDGMSKKGDPKATVRFRVVNSLKYTGLEIPFHTVTFIKAGLPGAGMALHFLKTIGEPFEGKFKINTENWVGKLLRGTVKTSNYTTEKGEQRQNNIVLNIRPYEGFAPTKEKEEAVPAWVTGG